jgi:hypothetical protein
VGSEADLQAAANIYQMNERTRANAPGRAGQPPLVTQDTRDDKMIGTGASGSGGPSGGPGQ